LTQREIAEDFAQDLPDKEKQLLMATQSPTAAFGFAATVTTAAWKTKPSWSRDCEQRPHCSSGLEKAEATAMKLLGSLSRPAMCQCFHTRRKSPDFIEQAAAKAGSR